MLSKLGSRSFQHSRLGGTGRPYTVPLEHVLGCLSILLCNVTHYLMHGSTGLCQSACHVCVVAVGMINFLMIITFFSFVPGLTFMTLSRMTRHKETGAALHCGKEQWCQEEPIEESTANQRTQRPARSKTRDCQAGPALFGPMVGKRLRAQKEWRTNWAQFQIWAECPW